MVTTGQLRKFVKKRNASEFASNLQFQSDAEDCGFKVADLGDVAKFTIDGHVAYQWTVATTSGPVRLVEFGRIYADCNDDDDTRSMFNLMNKRGRQVRKETDHEAD